MKDNSRYFTSFWTWHDKIIESIDSENKGKNRSLSEFLKPVICDDMVLIYKKVIAEINFYYDLANNGMTHGDEPVSQSIVGDLRIYRFILDELTYGNIEIADKFMVSPLGGYTRGQLNQIRRQSFRNHNQTLPATANNISRTIVYGIR